MQHKAVTGSGSDSPNINININLNDLPQVERWCAQLGCSPFELRNVVLSQGATYQAVKAYLQGTAASAQRKRAH